MEKKSSVRVGALVAGRFQVESVLGEGGMATVFRVFDIATKKKFALKLLKRELSNSAEALARLKREAEVLSTIQNPSVVAIETYGQSPEAELFLVMELLEGMTLGQKLREVGRFDIDDFSPIVAGVTAGLSAAHRHGIIHRDLKPDNIFLTKDSRGELQVKLLDFGISKIFAEDERLTQTGQVLGTPRYMAPEQLSAEHDIGARTDVYAFGVILYECLAGQTPFAASTAGDLIVAVLQGNATPLSVFRPTLSSDVLDVVRKAMHRVPAERFESAFELAQAWFAAIAPMRTRVGDPIGLDALPKTAESVPPSGEQPVSEHELGTPGVEEPSEVRLGLKPRRASGVGWWILAAAFGALVGGTILWMLPQDSVEPRALAGSDTRLISPVMGPAEALPIAPDVPDSQERIPNGAEERQSERRRQASLHMTSTVVVTEQRDEATMSAAEMVVAMTPFERARAAHTARDAQACVQELAQVPESAAKLLLEGECELLRDNSRAALKAWERLCVGHASAVTQRVREFVRSQNGRCD